MHEPLPCTPAHKHLQACLSALDIIDGLLTELSKANAGLRAGDHKYNSLAYAHDVTLFSSSVTGLQDIIQICADYADKWRFKYDS